MKYGFIFHTFSELGLRFPGLWGFRKFSCFAIPLRNLSLILKFASDAQKFQCPNDKNGQYEDEVQCDKYYECRDGIAKERLCPDGLVFDPSLRKVNKCDQPFNVECGERTELRKFYLRNILKMFINTVINNPNRGTQRKEPVLSTKKWFLRPSRRSNLRCFLHLRRWWIHRE